MYSLPRSLGNSSVKYLKDPEESSHRVVIGVDPNGTITMLPTAIEWLFYVLLSYCVGVCDISILQL